jgi:S1-C subfamily serine protease
MLAFNWVDVLVLGLLVFTAYRARHAEIPILLGVIGGFFGGLFLGGWIFPHLLPLHDRTLRTIINANLVLCLAIFAAVKGYDLGYKLRGILLPNWLRRFEMLVGTALSTVALLIAVWLIGTAVSRLPFAGLSNSASDAFIMQSLTRHLPPVPAVFSRFNRLIDANNSPYLFEQPVASKDAASVALGDNFRSAVNAASLATVRITSFGCGGVVSGSGLVTGPQLVMTNAHVIAGVKRPIIKYAGQSYEAKPVLFNSNLDLAMLHVAGLTAPSLRLKTTTSNPGEEVAILGYPNGSFTVTAGVIRNHLHVFGRNIYDLGVFGRDVYEIQAHTAEGGSGSPAVDIHGDVAGMVFAKSVELDDYSYVLTSTSLLSQQAQAEHQNRRVSTGTCLAST